jgi:protein-S-isoprenylcysteine O-methyltransferase Ste14
MGMDLLLRLCLRSKGDAMFVLMRTVTYVLIFSGLVLILLPAKVLSWSGVTHPAAIGWAQFAGIAIGAAGLLLALACVSVFVRVGKGTPAPFDPPRRLVTRGPYQFVRNPMYIGAGLAVGGAALYYESLALLLFAICFLIAAHAFVMFYEEPTLRRLFREDYDAYCRSVHRWLPEFRAAKTRRLRVISIHPAIARKR